MKSKIFLSLLLFIDLCFPSLNGSYYGIEFGHTHFNVTEKKTFTDAPSLSNSAVNSSSLSSPSHSTSTSLLPSRACSTIPGESLHSDKNESTPPSSLSFPTLCSSDNAGPVASISSSSAPSSLAGGLPVLSSISSSSSLRSTPIRFSTPAHPLSNTSTVSSSTPKIILGTRSISGMSFVEIPSASSSAVEVSSQTDEFEFSYHQSPSSGDERVSKASLKRSEDKKIPALIKSLSPICHAQNRSYRTPTRLYPTVFFKTGYGNTLGPLYLGANFKIGHTLHFNHNVVLLHRWNFGGDLRVGFYMTDECLLYLKAGIDRDKLVLHKTTDIYLWSFTKGIGIDHKLQENVFISLNLDHSRAIHYSSRVQIVQSKTSAISLRTGIGFMI